MKTMRMLGLVAAIAAAPLAAQTTQTTTQSTPTMSGSPAAPADAGAPMSPQTQQLNQASSAYVDARSDVQQAVETAQHRADRESYMAALIAHDRAVDRADARYVRQQTAYADAMAAWRAQVAACNRGNNRACKAPTPDPADFY